MYVDKWGRRFGCLLFCVLEVGLWPGLVWSELSWREVDCLGCACGVIRVLFSTLMTPRTHLYLPSLSLSLSLSGRDQPHGARALHAPAAGGPRLGRHVHLPALLRIRVLDGLRA